MTPDPAAIRQAVAAERERAERLFARLRRDGRDEPGVTRDPYGAGEQRAHATISEEAVRLGLEITRDAAANLYMRLPGQDRDAPSVIIGSHLDSVPHGGNFDGAAGVVAGLVTVAALRTLNVTPACDLTIMAIRAEESIWFELSYIGSRAALASLPQGALSARRRDTGRTLAQHIAECGGDPARIEAGERAIDPARLRAFLELHIEQAPSLVEAGKPVAVCAGIPGNFRYPDARIEGSHDHVGLPRRFRRDAALAGAEFFTALDRLWEERDQAGIPMACTIGRFHTDPALHGLTIVPGLFRFSLDVRAYDEAVLAGLEQDVRRLVHEIERRRRVCFDLGPRASATIGPMSPAIRVGLHRAAQALGIQAPDLGSPASHDAAAFAASGGPTGMIFVRNENGSHNPREAMDLDDFLTACAIVTAWLASELANC